jgi:hypothetical protein
MSASFSPPVLWSVLDMASVHDPCHGACAAARIADAGAAVAQVIAGWEEVPSRQPFEAEDLVRTEGPGIDRHWRTGWVRSNAHRRSTPGILVGSVAAIELPEASISGSKLRASDGNAVSARDSREFAAADRPRKACKSGHRSVTGVKTIHARARQTGF